MTMIDPTASPPDPPLPVKPPDLSSVTFRFDTATWLDPPEFAASDPNDADLVYRRRANDDLYRRIGNSSNWHRYITLGYYALDDGFAFDKAWDKQDTEAINLHRIIWYNFLYHVDRDMDIDPKLNAWATRVSEIYLTEHDPASLDLNTMRYAWKDAVANRNNMEVDEDEAEWTTVQGTRGRAKHRKVDQQSNTAHLREEETRPSVAPPVENLPPVPAPVLTDLTTPPTQLPDTLRNDMTDSYSMHTAPSNVSQPTRKPMSHVSVSTHDGTQRLTIRWTTQNEQHIKDLEADKVKLSEELLQLIKPLFDDSDGFFYHWESTHLTHPSTISQLTPINFRDYTSPTITFITSRRQIILGLRFGFTTSSVQWKNGTKKAQLDKAQIHLTVSNSKCSSGKLVTAGYILLKAPNTTHRHRYTQYLREKLPPETPFFDVIRLAKSPADQPIPHLAIQCGEHHVTPLCKALSNHLTGVNTAIFLPRYSFQLLTETQIEQHFQFHEKWNKSLVAIELGPMITHLDQPRTEYFSDGTVCERSTRHWATTLKSSDGNTQALCDVTNGSQDRKARLLVPQHYLGEARQHWKAYKNRISPPSHREARFQDSITDLPNVINITTEVTANVQFLEMMSSADIWSQAPSSVKEATHTQPGATQDSAGQQTHRINHNPMENLRQRNSSTHRSQTTRQAQQQSDNGFPPLQGSSRASSSLASDDQSTDSTQELTRVSQSTYQARFHEHEQQMKRQQKSIESLGKISSDRLTLIERQLHRFDAFDHKLATVGSQLDQFSTQQDALSASLNHLNQQSELNKEQVRSAQETSDQKIDALSTTVVAVMTALLDIRTQFEQLSHHVQNMSSRLPVQHIAATQRNDNTIVIDDLDTPTEMTHHPNTASATGPRPEEQSDTSVNSSSTLSAASKKSDASTFSVKSPVKKKRHRSKAPLAESTDMIGNTEDTQHIPSPGNDEVQLVLRNTEVVNLDSLFEMQQHLQQHGLDEFVLDSGEDNEDIEMFLTPPTSPALNDQQHTQQERHQHAPLNPQYNETMDSEGAHTK